MLHFPGLRLGQTIVFIGLNVPSGKTFLPLAARAITHVIADFTPLRPMYWIEPGSALEVLLAPRTTEML